MPDGVSSFYVRPMLGYVEGTMAGGNSMTRRHFQSMADSLKMLRPADRPTDPDDTVECARWETEVSVWRAHVRAMASVCAEFNSGFDRGRFYDACGYED